MKTIIKKLDDIVREYIQKNYKYCVLCGRYENIQVGHAISRKHLGARFNLDLVRGVCINCNYYEDQNGKKLQQLIIKEIGQEKFDFLRKKAMANCDLEQEIINLRKQLEAKNEIELVRKVEKIIGGYYDYRRNN